MIELIADAAEGGAVRVLRPRRRGRLPPLRHHVWPAGCRGAEPPPGALGPL